MAEVFDRKGTNAPAVVVNMEADWTSGASKMHVSIAFGTHTLDDALRLIKAATDGAPLFNATLEEGTS
jgi:hypothetical protein